MTGIINAAAEEAAAQVGELDGEPVACVFLIFDANGRCSAGSAVLPENLEMLAARLTDAAADVRDDLAAQLAELHQNAERMAAEAITKARH